MSREEFESRWLTIGTASKLESGSPTPEHDRNGLPIRPKQGQKGIGRLSIAHLGPLVVVLSKRADQPYVAAVVDWRVFENPYLRLEDVRVPIDTFDRPDELSRVLEALFQYHGENVWPEDDADEARNVRVVEAWQKYDQQSEAEGRSAPSDAIYESVKRWEDIGDEHLDAWPVWSGDASSGTAMIVLDVYPELACWVGEDADSDDDVNADVRKMLTQSLMGFVDPYESSNERPEFQYAFVVREGATRKERISWDQGVGRDDIEAIEHAIIGEFDEYGMFRGQIRAFGRAWVPWTYAPPQPLPQAPKGQVGPFSLVIGAFEQEPKNSTHEPEAHAAWVARAEQYAGLFVYRDQLRLLPYGRPNNDFFRIEHRRTKHAGREFWAHRRMFGRVAISRDRNPNLRDKAGREGLIENTALRRFRHLVEDFLRATARRFFGTDAPDRSATIAENKRRFEARAQAAARQHRRLSREDYVRELRAKQAPLKQAVERVQAIERRLERARADADATAIRAIGEELEAAHSQRAALRLPAPPRELGTHESDRRSYRDDHAEMSAHLDRLTEEWRAAVAAVRPDSPTRTAHEAFSRHESSIRARLRSWRNEAHALLEVELKNLDLRVEVDAVKYRDLASPILAQVTDDADIAAILDGLERVRDDVEEEFASVYQGYIRALQSLGAGVDLDTALQWADAERTHLEQRLERVSGLAQLGITFEIIGHELHDTQREVMRNLRRLPAQDTEAYRAAMTAYQGLSRRLKFLAPLQVGGRISYERITGAELAAYVESFFAELFARERITLTVSPAFRRFAVNDHRWRIYPVFINLLQNARYWVRQGSSPRVVMLDRVEDRVLVADSGPGVDPEDAEAIFELFFSRRRHGRGVGLYLARVNLAAGHHSIALAGEADRVLQGANFVIRFQGIEIDD